MKKRGIIYGDVSPASRSFTALCDDQTFPLQIVRNGTNSSKSN